MAFIHCLECNQQVSDKARSCPKCGYPVSYLSKVAKHHHLWTGIAVMPDGRVFVNFPRWSDEVPMSVAEVVLREGTVHRPEWNKWKEWNRGARKEWNRGAREELENRFVCVQSVVADRKGYLWVLDSGNPCFKGVIPGAPRLLKFDTRDGRLLSKIPYAEPVILPDSYLNDVRIDTTRGMAYLTDSETGAIIVTDLRSGSSRRLLDDHHSVKAEMSTIKVDGVSWPRASSGIGSCVHSDGIALSPDNKFLYFHALMGRTLYRVPTAALRDPSLTLLCVGHIFSFRGIWPVSPA